MAYHLLDSVNLFLNHLQVLELPIVKPCFFWGEDSFSTLHRSSTIAPAGSEVCLKPWVERLLKNANQIVVKIIRFMVEEL